MNICVPKKVGNKFIFDSQRLGKSPNVFKYYKDTFLNIHKIKLRRGGKNTQNCTKKIFMTQIITIV